MEVPSDYEGKLLEIRVKEGEKVKEGMVFAVIEVSESEQIKKQEKREEAVAESEQKTVQQLEPQQKEKNYFK